MATWSSCAGKTDDRMCGLAGDAFSIGFLQGYANGQGCPQQGNPMETIPSGFLCVDPKLRWIDFACLLLVTTLMKLIHWGFSPLAADSSASHGSRECLMRLMGSHYICHTPGLAYSALSTGG